MNDYILSYDVLENSEIHHHFYLEDEIGYEGFDKRAALQLSAFKKINTEYEARVTFRCVITGDNYNLLLKNVMYVRVQTNLGTLFDIIPNSNAIDAVAQLFEKAFSDIVSYVKGSKFSELYDVFPPLNEQQFLSLAKDHLEKAAQ